MDDALAYLSQLIQAHASVEDFDAAEFSAAMADLKESASKMEDELGQLREQLATQDDFAARFQFRVVVTRLDTAEEFLKSEGWL